ncbi:mannose-1-phosphate guanylyltransferase/mannose-6-phosphate isomerase [Desulfobacter hydrogenophilus]|uniref:mannose-1-phosphate guanylyltransferase n=1 Tax=Desulfobacter hydrogenophilus TaxID=2291 RepID=A0A328FBD1_9BACT|nr:mannose-1-phosphate guanylyltransferase/mannose-6-phosphate isomerase [Desulfobacter hydrogenophilus]NDY73348.1 mannose-1-phosphate guanylyltransferase/mannose-6-phosphate isomerase [Desulfobacter hydrogenophilus]QBH14047.1 mannose-1-phosphate guanylyltransferase/mannose-6-phosphate isomerase [Desulfobacter hydrogenophilus]RAM01609.1 mannose-1-phosphate guanylyltransferase/mannose-6-phosphate isomerase [Desulfobacter hydrogenophilus]
MIYPVILAGGSGTRLWPMSRSLYPKQLISLYNAHTMLQNTLLRLSGLDDLGDPVVICNENHRFMTAEQIRRIDINDFKIILEPAARNTAPAIALAALILDDNLKSEHQDDPVMLVLPADHEIKNIEAFHEIIQSGAQLARQGKLVTFGIVPSSPETGYGYIKKGDRLDNSNQAFMIDRFVEKPDYETAVSYLESGDFCWNSGMFMFKVSAVISELGAFAPDMLKKCRTAIKNGNMDLDFFRVDKAAFEAITEDSIDYAVMEKTDKGVVIPLDAGWNDLGSFDALWQTGDKDERNNVTSGDVLVHNVTDTYIHSDNRLVAAVGLEKFVIVDTKDALLVAPRDQVQDVKKIVTQLKAHNRVEAVSHAKVYRPWGDYETIDMADRYQVKRITVKPGAKLSLQKHFHRAEHWTVVSGTAIVTKGTEEILLKEDESIYIPLGTMHRLENPGKIPLELIEVQSGPYLGEDDIVRFDDVYGREKISNTK